MSKTTYINARIEPSLKKDVGVILSSLGLSTTEAINLYFRQIVLNKGIPFEIKLPNEETEYSMQNIINRTNLERYTDFDEVLEELKSEKV